MRLFLPQSVGGEGEAVTPPFLTDKEEDVRLALLRETTIIQREGKHRLPTPEKRAIMELSSSFEKRRLGKQQQILSEIAARCREQEVTDLSNRITAKVDLQAQCRGIHLNTARDTTFYSTTSMTSNNNNRGNKTGRTDGSGGIDSLTGLGLPGSPDGKNRRVNSDKAYKFFPARHIIRQQTKTNGFMTSQGAIGTAKAPHHGPINIPRNLRQTTAIYLADSYRTPRTNTFYSGLDGSQFASPGAAAGFGLGRRISNVSNISGGGGQGHLMMMTSQTERLERGSGAKTDPTMLGMGAPLVLPRLGLVSLNYQDKMAAHGFVTAHTARHHTVPRVKQLHNLQDDRSSVGGRSFNSLMNLNNQSTKATNGGGGDQLAEDQATDLGSLGSVVGKGFAHSVDNLVG